MVKSNADRLAALRDKLSKVDLRSGGGGFFSPPDGRSIIRIMPETGEMTFFYQQVGTHTMPGTDNKKYFYCPNFTSEGELDCPICDYIEDLKRAGDKASTALANTLRVKRKFWMNVINRDQPNVGPQIFTPGVMVFSQISSLISDPDYGDIFDIKDGIDIIIERKGQKLETEYQVKPRRDSSPLSDDEDQVKEWLDKARDLTPVEVSDNKEEDAEIAKGHVLYVLPYDRLKREFESADEDLDEVAEEEEEVRPPRLPKGKSVVRVAATPLGRVGAVTRHKASDPEEEEEDDLEDEDTPAANPVADEINTRTIRRSLRRPGR
ncbi:MAG: hypothetical protein WC479_00445 [Candidatus Izemoplasmatales bacterium]